MKHIILYPTDTLYGLGVDATDPEAIHALNELKGRPDGKHISIIVADMAMMAAYAEVTPLAQKLADAFLPGALTLVLTPKFNFSEQLTAGTNEIGIRIPKKENILMLVRELGKPLTATSANVSGMEPERTVQKILAQFGERANMVTQIIDEGELVESRASTTVDARGEVPVVLREGVISKDEIMYLV